LNYDTKTAFYEEDTDTARLNRGQLLSLKSSASLQGPPLDHQVEPWFTFNNESIASGQTYLV